MTIDGQTEARIKAQILGILASIDDFRTRAETITATPHPGSKFALDMESSVGRYVVNLASLKIAVAGDHLLAVRRLVVGTGPIPTWAHYSLLRVALETSLEARWLLDQTIGSPVRIGRAVGQQIYDFRERDLAEKELCKAFPEEWPPAELIPATTWIADLQRDALAAGISTEGFPGATALAGSMQAWAGGLDAYTLRFLGGAIHGVQWATSSGSVEAVDGRGSIVEAHAELYGTWNAIGCAMAHYGEAVTQLEAYAGLALASQANSASA